MENNAQLLIMLPQPVAKLSWAILSIDHWTHETFFSLRLDARSGIWGSNFWTRSRSWYTLTVSLQKACTLDSLIGSTQVLILLHCYLREFKKRNILNVMPTWWKSLFVFLWQGSTFFYILRGHLCCSLMNCLCSLTILPIVICPFPYRSLETQYSFYFIFLIFKIVVKYTQHQI